MRICTVLNVRLTLAIHKHYYSDLRFERNMEVNYTYGTDENWCDVHDRNRVITIVMKLLQVIILKTNKQGKAQWVVFSTDQWCKT